MESEAQPVPARVVFSILLTCLVGLFTGVAMADGSHPTSIELPRYRCPKVDSPPVLDGRIDDPAWSRSPLIERFRRAQDGEPATYATSARLCWDDENLYLAFRCEDPLIWATMTQRDEHLWDEEVVEFFVSPSGDLRRYFEIEVNPLGVICDLDITNHYTYKVGSESISGDIDWNAENMRVAVTVDGKVNDPQTTDISWTVEIAIPFGDLGRLTPTPGEVWRCNLFRIDRGAESGDEFTCWSPTLVDPPAFHRPQYFGFLEFVVENR